MIKLLLTSVIILLGYLVVAQDCPLPTNADIVRELDILLQNADGSQTYNVTIIGAVHYVCQSQGNTKGTYQYVSIIAAFTPNPGQPQQTNIFQLICNTGPTWSADTDGGLDTPHSSVVNGTTRTDCWDCNEVFGNDRCRGKL